MTIESKIAKNGATLYYVDGKRVSYRDAMMYQRQNRHFQEWRARIAREGEIAAINDYIVTTAAQDTATDAEINLAINDNDEVDNEVEEIDEQDEFNDNNEVDNEDSEEDEEDEEDENTDDLNAELQEAVASLNSESVKKDPVAKAQIELNIADIQVKLADIQLGNAFANGTKDDINAANDQLNYAKKNLDACKINLDNAYKVANSKSDDNFRNEQIIRQSGMSLKETFKFMDDGLTIAQIAEIAAQRIAERDEIMSTPLVTVEAQDDAAHAEIKNANAAVNFQVITEIFINGNVVTETKSFDNRDAAVSFARNNVQDKQVLAAHLFVNFINANGIQDTAKLYTTFGYRAAFKESFFNGFKPPANANYQPQTNWENPHDFTIVGDLSDRNINGRIAAFNHKEEVTLTDNMILAQKITDKLGSLLVKFSHANEGNDGGLALHYDTFKDEHDEFGTLTRIVEVFTDKTNFILDHVNFITGYGDDKKVEKFFFKHDDFNAMLAKLQANVDETRKVFNEKKAVRRQAFKVGANYFSGDFNHCAYTILKRTDKRLTVVFSGFENYDDCITRVKIRHDENGEYFTIKEEVGVNVSCVINVHAADILTEKTDELNLPSDKHIIDSLIRAMETCLLNIQAICLTKPTNLSAINREWELYQICNNALLRKEVA